MVALGRETVIFEYKAKSLSDIVEEYVKNQVLSGELKSGDKIVEADISETLHISRAPVREALRSLSVEGIVTFSPRRGHYVLEMDRDEVFEVFQIRISLELQVLRVLVTGKMLTDEDYRQLSRLAQQMEDGEDMRQNESERVHMLNTLDISFHRYLWAASGCKRRAQLLENLFYQLLIEMNRNVASLGSYKEKADEHRQLIEALQTGNPAKVCAELRHHLHKYVLASLGTLSPEEGRTLDVLFD